MQKRERAYLLLVKACGADKESGHEIGYLSD